MHDIYRISLAITFSIYTSCGPVAQNVNDTNSLVGENNLVNANPELHPFILGIGFIKSGCTASHIGDGYVITAGHCYSDYKHVKITDNLPCIDEPEKDIVWGYTSKTPKGYMTSKCKEIINIVYNDDIDFAVTKYEPAPETILKLDSDRYPTESQTISMFSHAEWGPLQWSGDCQVLGKNRKSASMFDYDCDTLFGSSGAPIFNSIFEVIGIHNRTNWWSSNAGSYLKDIDLQEIL